MLVRGFHGTTLNAAEKLLGGDDWLPSINEGDWLGYGSYFFEDGAARAMHWARLSCAGTGEAAAVLRVDIDLSNCLDLLDLTDFEIVRDIYDSIKNKIPLPTQEPLEVRQGRARPPRAGTPLKMRNKRDRFIVDYCVDALKPGREITAVRSAFLWGHALSAQSCLFNWNRVEIAVRDPRKAITGLTIEAVDDLFGR